MHRKTTLIEKLSIENQIEMQQLWRKSLEVDVFRKSEKC
ncbi:hypothetical protein Bhyg_07970 [Pseudolycoriella hygida]|uniref:Uncharacterized protein n=1 Tax=Pseudolycoriella hygida TaxID=35572 RepID=A0A9Q0N5J0_9DIPT|nr:hypothetical protein Bhyg_07970 [Pseudolycoriella hygida]